MASAGSLKAFWNHPAGPKTSEHFSFLETDYAYLISLFSLETLRNPSTCDQLLRLFLFAAVHFWAPTFKWGLVIAGLADINRPIEKVSTAQQSGSLLHLKPKYAVKAESFAALAATGVIWSRYATQIIPVNYNLLSVNVFVAITGLYQLARKNG